MFHFSHISAHSRDGLTSKLRICLSESYKWQRVSITFRHLLSITLLLKDKPKFKANRFFAILYIKNIFDIIP